MKESDLIAEIIKHSAGYLVELDPLSVARYNDVYIVRSKELRDEIFTDPNSAAERFIELRQINELGEDYLQDDLENRHNSI